jgi:hypothetical protein
MSRPEPSNSLRPLAAACFAVANICVVIAAAYFLIGRGGLPSFLPHARNITDRDDATDTPMAVVMLGIAAFFAYLAHYARTRRSWMRPRSWHRKHGRV